jgi:hypothetical protein
VSGVDQVPGFVSDCAARAAGIEVLHEPEDLAGKLETRL